MSVELEGWIVWPYKIASAAALVWSRYGPAGEDVVARLARVVAGVAAQGIGIARDPVGVAAGPRPARGRGSSRRGRAPRLRSAGLGTVLTHLNDLLTFGCYITHARATAVVRLCNGHFFSQAERGGRASR